MKRRTILNASLCFGIALANINANAQSLFRAPTVSIKERLNPSTGYNPLSQDGNIFVSSPLDNEKNIYIQKTDGFGRNILKIERNFSIGQKIGKIKTSNDGLKLFVEPPYGKKHTVYNFSTNKKFKIKINEVVLSSAFSPSGKYLTYEHTRGPDYVYAIYNTDTKRKLMTFDQNGSGDRSSYQWATIDKKEVLVFINSLESARFAGDTLPQNHRKSLITLNPENGEIKAIQKTVVSGYIRSFKIFHQKYLVFQGENKVGVIDLESNKVLYSSDELNSNYELGHVDTLTQISQDGRIMVVVTRQKKGQKKSFVVELASGKTTAFAFNRDFITFDCLAIDEGRQRIYFQERKADDTDVLLTYDYQTKKLGEDRFTLVSPASDVRCQQIIVRKEGLRVYAGGYNAYLHQFFDFEYK